MGRRTRRWGDVGRARAARGRGEDRDPGCRRAGCLDMVNFWAPETVPEGLRDRRLYRHNEKQTLVRTTPEENSALGRIIAGKLNASTGPVEVFFPLRGISVISA